MTTTPILENVFYFVDQVHNGTHQFKFIFNEQGILCGHSKTTQHDRMGGGRINYNGNNGNAMAGYVYKKSNSSVRTFEIRSHARFSIGRIRSLLDDIVPQLLEEVKRIELEDGLPLLAAEEISNYDVSYGADVLGTLQSK